jgi:hypothetical protein
MEEQVIESVDGDLVANEKTYCEAGSNRCRDVVRAHEDVKRSRDLDKFTTSEVRSPIHRSEI